jgi:hypothetical protein
LHTDEKIIPGILGCFDIVGFELEDIEGLFLRFEDEIVRSGVLLLGDTAKELIEPSEGFHFKLFP